MSKIIDSLVQASIDSKNYAGIILCRLEFESPTGFLRLNNTHQSIYWDEDGGGEVEYLGVGNLASIGVLPETNELSAQQIQLTLSGIPSTTLTAAFSDTYAGNPVYVWYGTLDKDTYAIEGGQSGPVLIFAGNMDYSTIEFGDTATIVVNATSRLADWERARGGRYNQSYQRRYVDPTDDGFKYMKALQNKAVSWGKFTMADPGGPTDGDPGNKKGG